MTHCVRLQKVNKYVTVSLTSRNYYWNLTRQSSVGRIYKVYFLRKVCKNTGADLDSPYQKVVLPLKLKDLGCKLGIPSIF